MEAIRPQRVYSFDHVAINDEVTTCDMKKVPLADEALDVAVYSLSLMGKNWSEYIKEAKRCLVTNGILMVAETTKSLKGRLLNLHDVLKWISLHLHTSANIPYPTGSFKLIVKHSLDPFTAYVRCLVVYGMLL